MRLAGARQAIHDATAIHLLQRDGLDPTRYGCRISTSSMGSANSLILDAMEAGRILAVIDRQRSHVRDWLLYAYGAETSFSRLSYLRSYLFDRLFRTESRNERRRAKIAKLCALAVDDLKQRYNNGRSTPQAFFCSEIEISEPNWRRDGFDKIVGGCHAELQAMDRIGLYAVSDVIRRLRGEDLTK